MLAYSIERLERLSDEHLKEIADLTAQAFAGDIEWLTEIGGDLAFQTEYCNAALRATVLEGELYILTTGLGEKREIASWVSWFPPGNGLFATEAQRALGYTKLSKKFTPEVKEWRKKTYPMIGKLVNEVFTAKERSLQWWCSILATRPDYQGNGFATALMDIGYQKAKKTKELGTFVGLMTQTEENVNKYTSMGFEKIGGIDHMPVPGGITSIHVMVRRP